MLLVLASLNLLLGTCMAAVTVRDVQPSTGLPRFMSQLEELFLKTNIKNPPFIEGPKIVEDSCPAQLLKCTRTFFWTKRVMYTAPKRVTIIPNSHVDVTLVNDGSQEAIITASKSTAVAKGTTAGWTIGGKVTLTEPNKIGSADLSYTYSDMSTALTTETTTVQYASKCPAGKTCRIKTVTFQARLDSLCTSEAYVGCSEEYNICRRPFDTLPCGQYKDYHKKYCSKPLDKPCQVDVQVQGDDGKLLKVVVLSEE